jgi:hypothetical protein
MFNTIDKVNINGRNKAFGGYIYSVDYQVGLLDSPTTMSVQFVNESGEYQLPELSILKSYKISIGNIVSSNFYAVSYEKSETSQGRLLSVNFVDGSHILDRIWVGLYKRMGDHTTNVPGLLIVGREMHPCDSNQDGVFDQKDVDLIRWNGVDPCELKCPNSDDDLEPVVDKCVQREIVEIFDVKYNFDDLLDALEGKTQAYQGNRQVQTIISNDQAAGSHSVTLTLPDAKRNTNPNIFNRVKIKNRPKNTNPFFFKDYNGTLREVLKNWCADFGWSFFWENDSLNFIDTKTRPKINLQAFSNLESRSESATLEGTVGRGYASYYSQAGIESETDCSKLQTLLLRCLSLRDLFGDYYKPSWAAIKYNQGDYSSLGAASSLYPPTPDPANSDPNDQVIYRDDVFKAGIPIASFEKSVVLSKYSQTLRNLWNLWNLYGIKTAQDAFNSKLKWLDRLGQIKILSVLSNDFLSDKFNRIKGDEPLGKGNGSNRRIIPESLVKNMQDYGGYLVLVLKNRPTEFPQGMLAKQFEIEQRLANDYFGHHWYRAFTAPPYQDPQFYPSAQYIGALSTNVEDIAFTNFNHTHGSVISKMVSSFVQRQKADYRRYDLMKYGQSYATNIAKKNVRSLVYFNRNADSYWAPNSKAGLEVSSAFDKYEPISIKEVDIQDLSIELKRFLATESGVTGVSDDLLKNLGLFVFYPSPTESGITVTPELTDHAIEEKPQHLEGTEIYSFATGGLLNNKCVKYTIEGVSVFTPQGGSVLFSNQGDAFRWSARAPSDVEFDKPVYKVMAKTSQKNRGIIPKTQSSLVQVADTGSIRVDYGFSNIDKDASLLLNKLSSACVIPESELEKIHETVSNNLNFSVSEPFKSYQYRIYGLTLPSSISIKDGLESIKVRVSDAGISTDITMSNKLFTPQSQDLIYKALELGLAKAANSKPKSI